MKLVGLGMKNEDGVGINLYNEHSRRVGFLHTDEDFEAGKEYEITIEEKWEAPKEFIENVAKSMGEQMMKEETISIKDEDGKEYVFERPEFEFELLKVVDKVCIGYVKTHNDEKIGGYWKNDGEFISGRANYSDWNLTLMKKPWYEDEKVLKKCKEGMLILASKDGEGFCCVREIHHRSFTTFDNRVYNCSDFRLITKAEKEALVCAEDVE